MQEANSNASSIHLFNFGRHIHRGDCALSRSTPVALLALFSMVFGFRTGATDTKVIVKEPLKIESARWLEETAPAPSFILEWSLAEGHHAYLEQFSLNLQNPELGSMMIQEISPVVDFYDRFSKRQRKGIEGRGSLIGVFQAAKKTPTPDDSLAFTLTYQACTDEFCHLPKKILLNLKSPGLSQKVESPPPQEPGQWGLNHFSLSGQWPIWQVLIALFIGGFLTSLTPCVFPMIPITLAVLGRREGQGARAGFTLSSGYVLGIALTYSLLGVSAALSGRLFGSLLSNPVVVGFLALFFVSLGFSLFGAWDLQLPLAWQQRIFLHKTRHGWLGALMAGAVAGVAAGPCVGPVLAGVLTYVAQSQDGVRGFLYLFVFALGMGQLFLWLGTFANFKSVLPHAGVWMEATKYLLGLSMLGLALFYLRPVLETGIWWKTSAVLFIGTAAYFLGKQDPVAWQAWGQILILGFIALGSYLAWSPPMKNTSTESSLVKLPWIVYSEDLLNEAKEQKKPVVLDFYADWCTACKELEAWTFSTSKVQAFRNQIVWLKFDATRESKSFETLRDRYGIVGLPHLVFIDANGVWRRDLTLTGFESADLFERRLQSLLSLANSR